MYTYINESIVLTYLPLLTTIGLEDPAPLPSSSVELQRKMAELDQRIAMHKAEIDNMSQDIVSATASDIGTSALANIALPSNLQQILDSIKTIGAATNETVEAQVCKAKIPMYNEIDIIIISF